MKLLIVDDEARIRRLICSYAKHEGHLTFEAADGLDAVNLCQNEDFDLVVMDVMMPALNGFEACKQIKAKKDIPVIMLTALGEEYDVLKGFDRGADDYVTKPFSIKELMARINAVALRYKKLQKEKNEVFCFRGLNIDLGSKKLKIDGQLIPLAPKEYELLVYLIENKNKALSRAQIIERVWGIDYLGDDRTLDTHVKLLRKSLGEYAHLIRTVRGTGYSFETQN
ncbi:MAG: response regulator transcription factor [Ruminococcaceae bacterium]|nr:response regulator transcription factor [Oscillospiraceae bacterium]